MQSNARGPHQDLYVTFRKDPAGRRANLLQIPRKQRAMVRGHSMD